MPTSNRPSNSQTTEKPSRESIERMLAFAGLLAAIEEKDRRAANESRNHLRALGVSVKIAEAAR